MIREIYLTRRKHYLMTKKIKKRSEETLKSKVFKDLRHQLENLFFCLQLTYYTSVPN